MHRGIFKGRYLIGQMCCFIYSQVSGSLEQALEKDWKTWCIVGEEA